MFVDYGILYYRKDINDEPPKSWSDLRSLDNTNYTLSNTIYIGQFNGKFYFFSYTTVIK